MFGRKKSRDGARAGAELLRAFIGYQQETEQMKEAARSSARTAAILRPQIPLGEGQSVGWFGGNAKLPEGMAWPEQDGEKLLFLGQINLAALPKDLWSGLGPRAGWLAFFAPGAGDFTPRAIHIDEALVETEAPLPNRASWTRIFNFKEPKSFALPRWPLILETIPGDALHQDAAPTRQGHGRSATLLDAAYHPFDRATTELLLRTLGEGVTRMAREIVRFPAMKKLRPEDAAWFQDQQPIILKTFVRFFEFEGNLRATNHYDAGTIASFIDALGELDAYDIQYMRDDVSGFAELVLRETKLLYLAPPGSGARQWWDQYEAGLTNHALVAYTKDPTKLPAPLRTRLEAHWRDLSSWGLGLMGHAPMGHIYTEHGPDSPNEVLLELPTSELMGWIWGDCYSLVLLIDRERLRRGDFSEIQFDITN